MHTLVYAHVRSNCKHVNYACETAHCMQDRATPLQIKKFACLSRIASGKCDLIGAGQSYRSRLSDRKLL